MIPAPEFPRPFAIDRLGTATLEIAVSANAEECAALTRRLAVPSVLALSCRWRLHRDAPQRIAAHGHLTARLTRECVVTLEDFESVHDEHFDVVFVPQDKLSDDDDPEAPDEIGYSGNTVDLGDAAAEQLALSLDPYPHKPGAALPDFGDEEPPAASVTPMSPFAALARRGKP